MALTHSDHRARSLLDRCRDTWFRARDRLLASPRFQRWAAGFPLTSRVAERRAAALFDIVSGFVYAQVLYASVKLKLFQALEAGPLPLDVLAARMQLPKDGMKLLLDAAVTLDLVARRGNDRYGLGSLGAAFLGNPGLADMVAHHALFYEDMADPVALLRDARRPGRLQSFWSYARSANPATLQSREVADYTALMASSQSFVADDILDAFPFTDLGTLMDVGGGDGSFLASAAARWPKLQVTLVDLPAVAQAARARFDRLGLTARARAVGCDFLREALPLGADAISLVRVAHDHDDAALRMILQTTLEALPPGGTLLIAEPMADASGAERVGAAYFNFYLRAMGSGRARSASELQAFLSDAGFVDVRVVKTRRPLMTGLVIARRSMQVSKINDIKNRKDKLTHPSDRSY